MDGWGCNRLGEGWLSGGWMGLEQGWRRVGFLVDVAGIGVEEGWLSGGWCDWNGGGGGQP